MVIHSHTHIHSLKHPHNITIQVLCHSVKAHFSSDLFCVCVCVEKGHCFKEELLEVAKTIQHLLLLVFQQQLSRYCGRELAIHPVCIHIHFLHFSFNYLCMSVVKIDKK